MYRRWILLLLVMLWSSWPGLGCAAAQEDDPLSSCDAAADAAEHSHQLPAGILAAIGRVESGRSDPADPGGRFAPWPWTINAAGAGSYLPSLQAAVAAVRALRQRGLRNIDVGCFQVNLEQHPDAFPTLEAAFDPQVNADYAADFLSALHDRAGSWDGAVAAYHSAVPALGVPYRGLVFAQWAGIASRSDVSADAQSGRVVVIAGVRIWTPGPPGTAPQTIRIEASAPSRGASLTK
jgi:hypothetical protein